MGGATVRTRGGGRGGFVTVLLAAVAVLASGCAGAGAVHVDPDRLPGVYRDEETGAEIRLHHGGRFSAVGIAKSDAYWHGSATRVDFDGTWNPTPSNFVYLQPDETGGLQALGDIQLWTASPEKVFLHPDVDGPVTLELARVPGEGQPSAPPPAGG
ncbi:hypothetical protein [Streptomyces sp. SAI-229]|uniref:hypothetical protein n=1 Tax=Streptomyces sp. SAI-229 TaxID=3377731 RepID=UPI003C7DEA30